MNVPESQSSSSEKFAQAKPRRGNVPRLQVIAQLDQVSPTVFYPHGFCHRGEYRIHLFALQQTYFKKFTVSKKTRQTTSSTLPLSKLPKIWKRWKKVARTKFSTRSLESVFFVFFFSLHFGYHMWTPQTCVTGWWIRFNSIVSQQISRFFHQISRDREAIAVEKRYSVFIFPSR